MQIRPDGAHYYPELITKRQQAELVRLIKEHIRDTPMFTPVMPRTGKPFSVRMTNFGSLGWVSDRHGYRYQPHHPVTGKPWAEIPDPVLEIWRSVTPDDTPAPDACLVNFYNDSAKMGLHRDEDEADLSHPVVSISLGDDALFHLGGLTRKGKTQSLRLRSGDVLVLCGNDRLAYHGITRIYPGTSSLLKTGGRINLTLRVAG